jgi:hypothetical protein
MSRTWTPASSPPLDAPRRTVMIVPDDGQSKPALILGRRLVQGEAMRLQVFSLAHLRCFGPFLLALFVLAQAAGVVPLISTHIQHALQTEQDIIADLSQSSSIDHVHHHRARHDSGQHEHGDDDPNDQCCTLHHHLAGVIPITIMAGQRGATLSIVVAPRRSLTGTDPRTLERPPKLPLAI